MSRFAGEIARPVVSHVDWAPSVRTYLFPPCDHAALSPERSERAMGMGEGGAAPSASSAAPQRAPASGEVAERHS